MNDKCTPEDLFDNAAYEVMGLRDLIWAANQALMALLEDRDHTITHEDACGRVCSLLRIAQQRADSICDALEAQRHKLATTT